MADLSEFLGVDMAKSFIESVKSGNLTGALAGGGAIAAMAFPFARYPKWVRANMDELYMEFPKFQADPERPLKFGSGVMRLTDEPFYDSDSLRELLGGVAVEGLGSSVDATGAGRDIFSLRYPALMRPKSDLMLLGPRGTGHSQALQLARGLGAELPRGMKGQVNTALWADAPGADIITQQMPWWQNRIFQQGWLMQPGVMDEAGGRFAPPFHPEAEGLISGGGLPRLVGGPTANQFGPMFPAQEALMRRMVQMGFDPEMLLSSVPQSEGTGPSLFRALLDEQGAPPIRGRLGSPRRI